MVGLELDRGKTVLLVLDCQNDIIHEVIGISFLRSAPENSKIASSTEHWAAFVIPRELRGACAGPGPRF